MIFYIAGEEPGSTRSGGTRKLADHVEILNSNGIPARLLVRTEIEEQDWADDDLIVVPEVFGHGLTSVAPQGIRRLAFVQNGYLIDMGTYPVAPHPFVDTPDLVAVMVSDAHSEELVRIRCPDLAVPIVRTYLSGTGAGRDFHFGPWPREKWVVYFEHKHEDVMGRLHSELDAALPEGWALLSMTGMDDVDVEQWMRRASIFLAPNACEGFCGPTAEAMISGSLIVAWPGGPSIHATTPEWAWVVSEVDPMAGGPAEYLRGRAAVVDQDDIAELREATCDAALGVDEYPLAAGQIAEESSEWFCGTYSREREVNSVLDIMERFAA